MHNCQCNEGMEDWDNRSVGDSLDVVYSADLLT